MPEATRTLVERLFAQHRGALQAFFSRRVRHGQDAADLAQEVYLRMLRIRDSDVIRDPEFYLFAVAGNLAKEHALLDRRRDLAVDIDDFAVQAQLSELPSFDGQIDGDQRAVRLREVLRQLPLKCYATVVLQYQYDMSYEEIAGQLGISTHMVKKYLGQALAHCRRRMARLG